MSYLGRLPLNLPGLHQGLSHGDHGLLGGVVLDAKDILRSGVIRDHCLSPHGEDLLDRFVEIGHHLDWAVGELG